MTFLALFVFFSLGMAIAIKARKVPRQRSTWYERFLAKGVNPEAIKKTNRRGVYLSQFCTVVLAVSAGYLVALSSVGEPTNTPQDQNHEVLAAMAIIIVAGYSAAFVTVYQESFEQRPLAGDSPGSPDEPQDGY